MSMRHPINQAVIAQALHDLETGQLRHARSMGFSPRALEALKHPNLVGVLVNSQVAWCSVRVNPDIVERVLERAGEVLKEVETIDRMLRLHASTEMVCEFYALTHQEVALRRQLLDLPNRKGRWPVLSESQDAHLWEAWKKQREARKIALKADFPMLLLGMDLAEQQHIALSVIWSQIKTWIEQKLV
jgi:hypothetical protein